MKKTKVVAISLYPEDIEILDKLAEEHGGRSQAVRALLHEQPKRD